MPKIKTTDSNYDAMQDRLRKEYSVESLKSNMARENAKNVLIQLAKDKDINETGKLRDDTYYNETADKSINDFINNWKNKDEDNRGRPMVSLSNIAGTIDKYCRY